jgi:hypothetical protein
LKLFVFVVVFVVFETEKYERCEFQYEVGKNRKRGKVNNNFHNWFFKATEQRMFPNQSALEK